MVACLLTVRKIHRGGVFNMIDTLDAISAQPQSDEIFSWFQKNLVKQEIGSGDLAHSHTHKLTFLGSVCVYNAITVRIIKNNRHIAMSEI